MILVQQMLNDMTANKTLTTSYQYLHVLILKELCIILSKKNIKSMLLIPRDQLEKSDAVIVLTGNGWERTLFAIELFQAGWAHNFVTVGITGSRPAPMMAALAKSQGIPESSIIVEVKSKNTHQNAENIVRLCLDRNWHKIILVTSLHHQLRAHLTFRKVLKEIGAPINVLNYPPTKSGWFDLIESSRNPGRRHWRFWYIFSELYRIVKYRFKGDL